MHPFPDLLKLAVLLEINRLAARGGPQPGDWEDCREAAQLIVEKGDILLFSNGKKDEVSFLFSQLARSIAVAAFVPGGIRCFGELYVGTV